MSALVETLLTALLLERARRVLPRAAAAHAAARAVRDRRRRPRRVARAVGLRSASRCRRRAVARTARRIARHRWRRAPRGRSSRGSTRRRCSATPFAAAFARRPRAVRRRLPRAAPLRAPLARDAAGPPTELRSLLPPELADVAAEIRVVANSNVAAASGCLTPTIWIGDRYTGERLRLTARPRDVARARPRSALARGDRGRAARVLVEPARRAISRAKRCS